MHDWMKDFGQSHEKVSLNDLKSAFYVYLEAASIPRRFLKRI